ncbi:MAG TPA: hypothetical protein VJT72_12740 [Pseudonocardiaceae bacterium]|nr:hypothetical protein [Pseudonocardiaceae bacterium]
MSQAQPGIRSDIDKNELDGYELDPQRLDYFQRYFTEYFQDEFIPGQGTEHILDTIAGLGAVRRWLDLGSGPSTLFWSLPLADVDDIHCVDASPEALTVLRDVVRSSAPPPRCYQQVLHRYGKDEAHFQRMRRRVRGYHVAELLNSWPDAVAGDAFDLVTEFGLFGLSPGTDFYRQCFRRLAEHLPAGGRAVGADWVRSAELIALEKHDNTYLTEDLVWEAVTDSGLKLRTLQWCPIVGDELYDALIVWSVSRDRTDQ